MAGEAVGSSDVYRFDVNFNKAPGTLSVTPTHIAWVPTEPNSMDRQNQAMNRAINMLASKAGSKAVSLKILFKDNLPAGGLHFVFSNLSTREDDRKTVQDLLIPFVAANKNPTATGETSTPGASGSGPATPSTSAAAAVLSANAKGKRKAEDGSPATPGSGGGVSSPAVGVPAAVKAARKREYKLRQRVLEKNPTLRSLHQELVLGKQIAEEEFWDGREALIQAEEMAYAQKPGRASRLLDDRFDLDAGRKGKSTGGTGVGIKQAENGPVVLKLSKELTREIFEEFPVVQDAYAKHVPGISETEFWSRYFTSQLWERHRASVRKSANDELQKKKDDIFDAYLEEPDWNVQPRQLQPDDVERFLDLAATEEDHGEALTVRDPTMQAGRERSALPLIRRFNDHSKKLLRAAEVNKDSSALTGTLLGAGIDIYNEIDLEDLHGPAAPSTITLDVQDAETVNGDADDGPRGIIPGKTNEELLAIASESMGGIHGWHTDFAEVCLPNPGHNKTDAEGNVEFNPAYEAFAAQRDAQAAAVYVVKDLHVRANAENAVNEPFPEVIHEQMRSCHNAATEFLRQYWSSILPSQPNTLGANTSASAKDGKASKMAGYLRNTGAKVEAIVQTAQIMGYDPERVRKAMAPTVGAVNVALQREAKRVKV